MLLIIDFALSSPYSPDIADYNARSLSAASGVYFIFFNQLPPIPVPNHLHQSNLQFQLAPLLASNQASA